MNPLLPLEHCVPDAEPHVWSDGRLHLYGSYDIPGDDFYCSTTYHAFSTDDLLNWRDHGQSFSLADSHIDACGKLFAPDCMEKESRYYLTYCGPGGKEGIAIAKTPEGPFTDAYALPIADDDAIDPSIILDDDGEVYYYWGQHDLRAARMMPDLRSLDESTLNRSLLNEPEHGFHEGPSIHKRDGWYYMVYCDTARGKATCLSYAMSRSPLGLFEKKGVIIDNEHCDPESWNNHGGMCAFKGQWYIFYHRSSQKSRYSRRACCEPITFNQDGTIDEVKMTTQGSEGPLDPCRQIEASRFCEMRGNLHVQVRGIDHSNDRHREWMGHCTDRDWAAYRSFAFTSQLTKCTFSAASMTGSGAIHLRLDSNEGPEIGICPIPVTRGWQDWQTVTCNLTGVPDGVHELYLCFFGTSGHICDVEHFTFS